MTCCANIAGYHEIQDERITAPVFSNANPLVLPLHKKQEDLTNKSILFDLLRKGVCLSAQKISALFLSWKKITKHIYFHFRPFGPEECKKRTFAPKFNTLIWRI